MIKMTYDLHTHSTFSDGKNTIAENVEAAINKGLTRIGVTDHAYKHMAYGVKLNHMDAYLKAAGQAKCAYKKDIDVLVGMEFDLLDLDGNIDLPADYADEFDIKLLGMHKAAKYSNIKAFAYLMAAQTIKGCKNSQKVISANTNAFIAAIARYNIDVLVHPGYIAKVDIGAIAKACEEKGTLLEINARHNDMTAKDVAAVLKTKTRFVLGSDAHRKTQVGTHGYADAFVKAHGLTLDRIDNATKG